MADTRTLIQRLLDLSAMAVDHALELDYGDPEDRYIYRELQELKSMVAEWMERHPGEAA
jgi:hypothetical protein